MESRPPSALVLVALVALLSGCAGVGLESGGAASSPAQTAAAPAVEDGAAATVVEVVDGDTIDVRYANGSTDRIRLLGVDTPEVHADNDPAEYEGVPDTGAGAACLESAGEGASAVARDALAGARVTVVTDPAADRRDRYGRLLAYVHVDAPALDGRAAPANATGPTATAPGTAADGATANAGPGDRTDFNHWLVATGNARVYDSTFARSESYYAAEADAQETRRGLWRCRAPGANGSDPATGAGRGTNGTDSWASGTDPGAGGFDSGAGGTDGPAAASESGFAIERVHADAAGNDHENLNDEFVVFGNQGDAALSLGDWTVRDEADHTYAFPEGFALGPGETVGLYSGSGSDTDDALFWGSDGAIWNNGGDTVIVERDRETVLRYTYG